MSELAQLRDRINRGDTTVSPADLANARAADDLAEMQASASAQQKRAAAAAARSDAALAVATDAAARWSEIASDLAQRYQTARDAIEELGTACADYARDFSATVLKLEAAAGRGDLPPNVKLHRHGQLLPITTVTVDGSAAEAFEPIALIAEAVLEGAREAGLANTGPMADGHSLTNAALMISGRMENRDRGGTLIIQSPAQRLQARAHTPNPRRTRRRTTENQ